MDKSSQLHCVRQAFYIAASSQSYLEGIEAAAIDPLRRSSGKILKNDTEAYRKSISNVRERLITAERMLAAAGFPAIPSASLLLIVREAQSNIDKELKAEDWPSSDFQKAKDAINRLLRTAVDFQERLEGKGISDFGIQPIVRCLVVSDLHLGMTDASWDTVRNSLIKAFCAVHRSFPLDIVLFVGDLVNRGDKNEFSTLNGLLHDIWANFKPNCNPILLTVPGNHDLVRPKDKAEIDAADQL